MPAQPELINVGLALSRDASLLQPGELSAAEDVMASPGGTSLQKAPGRLAFGSIVDSIDGLGFCNFDSAESKLAIVADGSYHLATAGESGSFVELTTGAGTTLDVVSTQDKVILLSGGTTNRVLLPNGTSRPHGLRPVAIAPGLIHTATGGTWPLGATSVPGFYEYWTSEVYKSGADATASDYDEVESTFEGTTSTLQVTAITSYVTITRPNVTNPDATHWRIYRSDKKDAFFQTSFPLGFLIADVPINTVEFNDGLTITSSFTSPTIAVAATAFPSSIPIAPYVDVVMATWIDPGDVTTDDANTTTSPLLLTTRIEHGGGDMTMAGIECSNFGFTNIGSPITSIQVKVEGSRSNNTTLSAYLSSDNGTSWAGGVAIPLTTSNATVTVDGGQWGRVWNGGEFVNGSFKLLLLGTGPVNSGSGTITLDYAQVAVTHSGSTAQQVVAFPSIELLIGGERFPRGANGAPPRATTGDIFQGAMLMNDVENPTHVAWTIPGTIDYSPVEYRAALEDKVKCIRSLGDVAVVGGQSSLTRFHFLPVAEDPEFNTGRAIIMFDTEGGVGNNKAMVRFLLNGRLMLFYISQHSLRMTDGYQTMTATDDISWTKLVLEDRAAECFVENNPRNQELLVHFPSASGAVDRMLRLSYDPLHLKNGKLRVIGITNYGANAATAGTLSTGKQVLYTAKGSSVYTENRGLTDGSGGSITPRITTREIHLAGLGSSWELPKIGVHQQGGGGVLRTYATTSLANWPDTPTDPQTSAMDNRGLLIIDTASGGDGIKLTLEGDDDGLPWEIDYLVLYPLGQDDSAPLTR
jgi:hypothetical protein